MKIVGIYSFNNGESVVNKQYPDLLKQVTSAIIEVDASTCKTKKSKEKTMMDKMLYSPSVLNKKFKAQLCPDGWRNVRVRCDYPTEFYVKGYSSKKIRGSFREMDFVKRKLGVEVQFGKYSFMVYNVAAKMTIFKNLGYIDTGIEIVPVKAMSSHMSSGVSYFEQFVWDLEKRGISNIDVPVLIVSDLQTPSFFWQ